jgi:hypothetical protein
MKSEIHTIGFAVVSVHLHERFVLSVFRGGGTVVLDIDRSHNDWYRDIARQCGYEDHTRYARHHDLTHHWLAHQQHGGASPTLWAVANGTDWEGAVGEEHHVNSLQRLWADQRAGRRSEFTVLAAAVDALGADWRVQVEAHWRLLDVVL